MATNYESVRIRIGATIPDPSVPNNNSIYLFTIPACPFPTFSLDHTRPTRGTPVGKCLALRTHHQLPHFPSSMSRILCSRGLSSVSFCCCCSSDSSALSDSGCCCYSGSPALFGLGCPSSTPTSGSPLASVSACCSSTVALICSTPASFAC